jgi:hypothetical protein
MSNSTDLMLKKILPLALATSVPAACAYPSINEIAAPPKVDMAVVGKVNPTKVVELEIEKKSWKCPGCNTNEQHVLKKLQEQNIHDRNALATIMGNIKQESNFHPNICEGGARVPYDRCYRGGYGLIQWTTEKRYLGLGKFAKKYGCDPSTIECQTRYMINEYQFQKMLPEFQGQGFKVDQYMVPCYYWLGWGIKGARQTFAYQYTKKLVWN